MVRIGPGLGRRLVPLFHLWFRLSRGMTLGVRAVVLNEHNEVFLIRHTYYPGWHFPGGGVEVGETLEEAMMRELLEEARIVPADPPRLHGVFLNRKISVRDHVAVFVVRRFRTLEVKQPDREIAAAGFFPVAELPQDTSPGTAQRLEEINGATPLSPFW